MDKYKAQALDTLQHQLEILMDIDIGFTSSQQGSMWSASDACNTLAIPILKSIDNLIDADLFPNVKRWINETIERGCIGIETPVLTYQLRRIVRKYDR